MRSRTAKGGVLKLSRSLTLSLSLYASLSLSPSPPPPLFSLSLDSTRVVIQVLKCGLELGQVWLP